MKTNCTAYVYFWCLKAIVLIFFLFFIFKQGYGQALGLLNCGVARSLCIKGPCIIKSQHVNEDAQVSNDIKSMSAILFVSIFRFLMAGICLKHNTYTPHFFWAIFYSNQGYALHNISAPETYKRLPIVSFWRMCIEAEVWKCVFICARAV